MELTKTIAFPELTDLERGDEQAFAELVSRQARFVFRVAYAVLRNASDAEDVVQDTFFKLHRTAAWQHVDDERAFLARAAWRLAVNRIPRRQPVLHLTQTVPSHEQAVIDENLCAIVHRLIDALPVELRQPLALSAIEELNSRQIAVVLDIPEGTVRTRIMRARQILKEKLAARQEAKRHD